MRISKALKESMIMHGNLNKPAKPLSKEAKERRDTANRKARNKRKAARKIVYRYPQIKVKKSVVTVMNIFWFSEIDGVFCVFKANPADGHKNPIRKYKIKSLAMGFCLKANSKVKLL